MIYYLYMDNGYCLYINLESSKKRNESIIKLLKKINIRFERIDAIANPIGAIGCLKSHIKSLEYALTKEDIDWFLILEDDATFNNKSFDYISSHLKNINTYLKTSPVILPFTHLNNKKNIEKNKPIHKNTIYCNGSCTTTLGYFIKKDYIPKLLSGWKKNIDLYEENISNEMQQIKNKEPHWKYNADVGSWTKLQKEDKWLILYPYIFKNNEFESDIIKLSNNAVKNPTFSIWS